MRHKDKTEKQSLIISIKQMKSVSTASIAAIVLLIIHLPNTASAINYRVIANVVNNDGKTEEFVTWRIFTTDSIQDTLVAGNVSGQTGEIVSTLPSAGDYRLSLKGMEGGSLETSFSVSDRHPEANLGTLALNYDARQLDEITVTAQKPIVVKEIDRLAYDVTADPESRTSPLIDILRKVPMVAVDGEGNITVNGSSDFKVYKNGRPNNSFTKNAKDIFKAIPASSIRKIEVITDPGAREDAEGVGAVLNIITDSSLNMEGITGTASLYGDTNNSVPTPRLWLSSQIGKVTFSLYGNYYNINRRETEYSSTSIGEYDQTGQTLTFEEEGSSKRNAYSGGFELSYEPDTLNLITASFDIYQNYGKTDSRRDYIMEDANGTLLQSYTQTSFYPQSQYLDLDGNINYQRSTGLKGENITLSYRISTTGQQQDQQTDYTDAINLPVAYSGIKSNFDLRFFEHTVQLDWTRPIASRHTLDVGAKYIARRNHSKNFREYVGSHESYDDFFHKTDIAAAYADFRAKIGKFGFRGGFRYEYSRLGAKFRSGDGTDFNSHINDYVPNATVSYSPDDANSFKVSFNRRISRPGISYLDPTISSTPQSTTSGNPHLKSTNFNTLQFNYGLIKSKFNFDFSLNYSFSNNALTTTMDVIGDHIYYSYGNTGHFRQISGFAYAQWSPTDKTSVHVNTYLAYVKQKMPDGTELERPVYNPSVTLQQKLPWRMRLIANIGWWSGSVNSAYTYMKPTIAYFWNNLRLQRFFMSEDRLTVGLGLQNPFGPYNRKTISLTRTPDYYCEYTSCSPHNFSVSLSVSYRFGSLKASVKKTAASIENDDLQGRKN